MHRKFGVPGRSRFGAMASRVAGSLALAFVAFATQAAPSGVAAPESALDAGEYRTCALREDSTLMCWGDANYGDYEPPTGRYVAVSVGVDHACALRPGGQAACWGNPSSIATPPPAGSYSAIAAGNAETCAIRTDGQLRCWGGALADAAPTTGHYLDLALYNGRACAIRSDGALQCWQAAGVASLGATPSGRFLDVGLGQSHACALRSDGEALCWGSNAQGQTAVPAATTFVALGVGYQHTCGVRENGTLACWGANPSGQLTVPAGRFTALTVGRGHACARNEEGAIRCWGDDGPGKGATVVPGTGFNQVFAGPSFGCGLTFGYDLGCVGDTTAMMPPVRRYLGLSFGATAACGVLLDGQIECWGQSLGASPPNERLQYIAVGGAHACGIRMSDRTAVCWGDNSDGQATPPADTFSAIVSGDRFSCGIKDNNSGRVVCWGQGAAVTDVPANQYFYSLDAYGANVCGYAGGSSKFCWGADAAALQPPAGVLNILTVGARHACAIQYNTGSRILCWGDNSQGQLQVPADDGYYKLDAYGDTTCAYNNAGMKCWGAQTLSRGNPGFRMAPVDIAAGDAHTCTVRGDRGVGCWGDTAFAQTAPPVHRAQSISANADHTCTQRAGEDALCWGDNLHDGSTPPATPLRALDLGQFNGCGVTATGSASCWGWNVNAQSTPPADLFRRVATGLNHSCGVRDDGTLACWGYNADGQATPPAGTYAAVDVGERHSCALTETGVPTCWGLNTEGQATPPDLGGATYRALSVGAFHTCGILSHGGIACWGRNANGQSTPPEEGQYVSIASGTAHTCAVRDDGGRVCWGANESGQAPQPTLSPATLPTIRNGQPLSIDFRLDGNSGYAPSGTTFRMVSGKIPYGTYLNAAGQVRGTPADILGDYTLTMEATDENGFVATRAYTYTLLRALDTTPPYVEPQVGGEAATREWYSGDFTLTWRIVESETTATLSGCGPRSFTQDADRISITCTASSEGGTTTRTILIGRDSVAPDTTLTQAPPAILYSNDYYTTVDFSFASPGDDRSGLAGFQCSFYGTADSYFPCSSPFSFQLTASETPYTLYVRAIDAAGNADPTPVLHQWIIRRDNTFAVITPEVAGTLGDNNWYVSDVSLHWSIVDPETPITIIQGCVDRTITADTAAYGGFCHVRSLPGEIWNSVQIKRDATPPTVVASTAAVPNAAGWHRQNVAVTYTCVEATSGLTTLCPATETLSQEGRNISTTAKTLRDYAGNTGTSNVITINLDKTIPLVVTEPRTPANAFGWYRNDVTIDFTCTETLSGLAAPCPSPYTFTGEGRDLTYVVPVSDIAGNQTIGGRTLSIDRTAPTIAASATTSPNAAGWYRGNVGVSFSCADALSGINGVCPSTQTLSQEGAAISSSAQTTTDYAGNSATSNVVTAKIDKTAPTIAASVSPQPNAAGWNKTDATVNYACADALSGIGAGACPSPLLVNFDVYGLTPTTRTVTDVAGNTSAPSNSLTVRVDKTAPTASVRVLSTPNANGWHRSSVTLQVVCADAMSGVVGCPDFVYLTEEGASVSSGPWIVNDAAGNASAPSNTVTVKIDRTAPTLNATMPPATLLLNATHDFQLSATDALSGIASQSCSGFDTTTVGTRLATCSATDMAGNLTTRSATYKVVYGYAAVSAPLTNPMQVYVAAAPRSVPFEWRLFDANGAAVTNATLTQTTVTDVACPDTGVNLPTPPAGETNGFAHLGNGVYRRNWWINYTTTGCVRLEVTLNDGSVRSGLIRVVPKTLRTGGNYPSSRPPTPTSNASPSRPVQTTPATTAPTTRHRGAVNPRRPDLQKRKKK